MDCNSQLPQRQEDSIEAARDGIKDFSIRDIKVLLRALQNSYDLPEQENAEFRDSRDRLKMLRDSFAEMFEFAPVAQFSTDQTGQLENINRAGIALLNIEENQWRGASLVQYILPDDQDIYRQHLRNLNRTLSQHTCQVRLSNSDSQPRTVKFASLVFNDIETASPWIQTFVTDVISPAADTETLQDSSRLVQTQKIESLGTLAGGIAHEFNNLLMVISGNVDLSLTETPKDSATREYLEEIKSATLRATHLSSQMLAYSGKGHTVLDRGDLNELLTEMRGLLAGSAGRETSLKYELATARLPIEADFSQIQQVVSNLVTNAAEAIENETRQIIVRTGFVETTKNYLAGAQPDENIPAGKYVFVEVADTGCGMDEDIQQKIFDPFFTTKFAGRGLGLAVVLGVVRGHCGAVLVDSAPGKGSTFRILLPAAEKQEQSPETGEFVAEKAGPDMGMVLVVDDEESVLHLTELMLEKAGLAVVTANSGDMAVELFQYGYDDIGVVLLDIFMPGLSGEETFRQLREIRNDIPIFVCSGFGEENIIQSFAAQRFNGFFLKPYDFEKLIRMIRATLQKNEKIEKKAKKSR